IDPPPVRPGQPAVGEGVPRPVGGRHHRPAGPVTPGRWGRLGGCGCGDQEEGAGGAPQDVMRAENHGRLPSWLGARWGSSRCRLVPTTWLTRAGEARGQPGPGISGSLVGGKVEGFMQVEGRRPTSATHPAQGDYWRVPGVRVTSGNTQQARLRSNAFLP